ncbi:hypothetical protein BKA80DRAFT_253837 [Phyllosticta citrichinensis]
MKKWQWLHDDRCVKNDAVETLSVVRRGGAEHRSMLLLKPTVSLLAHEASSPSETSNLAVLIVLYPIISAGGHRLQQSLIPLTVDKTSDPEDPHYLQTSPSRPKTTGPTGSLERRLNYKGFSILAEEARKMRKWFLSEEWRRPVPLGTREEMIDDLKSGIEALKLIERLIQRS